MAILGFFFCALILVQLTIIGLAMFAFGTGKWTIGGAVQPTSIRIISFLAPFVLSYLWYELFNHSPFTIVLN